MTEYTVKMKWFEHLRNIATLETGPIEVFDQFHPNSAILSMFDLLLHPTVQIVTEDLFKPLCGLNSSVTTLSLSGSFIKEIEGLAFVCFPNLRELDLSRQVGPLNNLPNTTLTGLDHLERLSLRTNAFLHIPSAAFKTFARTGSLKHLDMGENRLDGNFPYDAFISITSLTHLDISHNPLRIIGEWLDSLINLTYLNMEGITSVGIVATYNAVPLNRLKLLKFNKPLYSDILQNDFRLNASFTVLSQKVPNLTSLNLASLSLYTLSTIKDCRVLKQLDVSGSVTKANIIEHWYELFFPDMKVLKLAQNKIISMEKLMLFKVTPNLIHLDLSDNIISTIDDHINALDLEYLNLNNNLLSSLDALHNLNHMKSLKLANNLIKSVPSIFVHTLMKSDLKVFNIASNPLACTCAIESFQKWVLFDNRVYIKPNVNRCNSPNQFEGLSLTQVKLNCRSHIWEYIAISGTCCVFVCLILAFSWRYRWHIRYKIFLIRNWNRVHYDNVNQIAGDFEMVDLVYDAFVSYAHESDRDLDWVLNVLRPNLEEGPEPVKLCIGQARDFIPGTNLFDSITEAIHRSGKSIVILSPSYVDSELCYFETQHAWKRLLEESRDVLILILLDPIPDDKMTIWLRQLLLKKGYLRWPHGRAGQQLFWRCVRQKIKKRTLVNRRFDA